MKKHWIFIFLVAVIAAGMLNGCKKKEDIVITDEKTLCGMVRSVEESSLVLAVGEMEDLTDFFPNGEEMIITVSDNTKIEIMIGIKKSMAGFDDVGVGDILAVTMKADETVAIVIHPEKSRAETS